MDKLLGGLFIGAIFFIFFINWAYWTGHEHGKKEAHRKLLEQRVKDFELGGQKQCQNLIQEN